MMKRTASAPTSSTTSRKVTKSPERFDILTGSPARIRRTSWQSRTSSVRLAARERRHRRLHALDIAAVVGAPDVDEAQEAAVDLGLVIGDVAGEIGVAAVRLDQRPVDVVAEIGGAEQGLLAILPILRRARPSAAAAGPRRSRPRSRRKSIASRDAIGPPSGAGQRALGGKHVVVDARAPAGRRESSPSSPAMARARTSGSHSASGWLCRPAPNSRASASPTGFR